MRRILQQPALAACRGQELTASAAAASDVQIEHYIRGHADTIGHQVGTGRIGPGPLDVVDSQLRVHGVQRLRVVDASIMPRFVSGNTSAPMIELAEKSADLTCAA